MLVFRRLCSLILLLALTLAPLASASHASGMSEMGMARILVSEGAGQSMTDNCADCDDGAKMAACAEAVCGMFPAVLPREYMLAGSVPVTDVSSTERIDIGIHGPTDPPPPRTFVLG